MTTLIKSDVSMRRVDRTLCPVRERLGCYLIFLYVGNQRPFCGILFSSFLRKRNLRESLVAGKSRGRRSQLVNNGCPIHARTSQRQQSLIKGE